MQEHRLAAQVPAPTPATATKPFTRRLVASFTAEWQNINLPEFAHHTIGPGAVRKIQIGCRSQQKKYKKTMDPARNQQFCLSSRFWSHTDQGTVDLVSRTGEVAVPPAPQLLQHHLPPR